jgi:uncharacterized protein (DUF433 family)
MRHEQAGIGAPVTDSELDDWEARARQKGTWSDDEVLRLITEVRRLRQRARRPRITRIPGRCGGAPAIAGTRIGVADVVALARRYEWDLERVRAREFPHLQLVDLMAAVEYYRGHEEEIEEILRRNQESFERLPPAPSGG